MNWKFTLILVAIIGALYLFFTYYEENLPPATEDHVFAFDRNQIDGLTILDHDQKIELVRAKDNKWQVKSPLSDRADQNLVDQVLTNLEVLRKDDTISGKDLGKGKLADYGLQTPRERLVITAHGGHTTEADFGNETIFAGKTYLQLVGTPDVLVVGDELKKLLGKDVNAWRDHRLTDLAATDVNKVVVKSSAGEIELQKDADHWKLVKPLAARADDTKVNDAISQITNLTISGFVADDKAADASYGLAEPKGTITLYTPEDSKGTELLVGNNPPAPKPTPAPSPALTGTPAPEEPAPAVVYARLPARQSIYTVPNSIETILALKPADLRDHSLVRVNQDSVDRIHFAPAEGSAFTFSRKEQAWTILDGPAAGQPVDSVLVDKLLTLLTGANVFEFVADSASDLAKYGLDKPSFEIKLASYASSNTAESNAGEKAIKAVSFGKSNNALTYARVEDEPFVVSIPKALLDELPTDSLAWQSNAVFQSDPAKINTLEVAVQGRPVLTLTRPDKGEWTNAGKTEGALNKARAQSVANTLSRLRAVRWLGPVKPEYGFDKPSASFKFGAGSDAKPGGRLVLGGKDPTGATYAQVDGKPGAFLVAQPDDTVLTAELIPGTAPATPAPTTEPATTPLPSPEATPAITPPSATAAPTAAVPIPTPVAAPTLTPTPIPIPVATPASTPEPAARPVPSTPMPTPPTTPDASPVSASAPPATATPAPAPPAAAPPVALPSPEPATVPSPVPTPADIPAPSATPAS